MVRTEPAVIWTPLFDFRSVGKWDRSRLVELAETRVRFGVPVDQSFERSTVGAPLRHEHLVISQQDFCIDHSPALGTYAAGELVEDVVSIFLSNTAHDWVGDRNCGIAHRPYAPEVKKLPSELVSEKGLAHLGRHTAKVVTRSTMITIRFRTPPDSELH